MKLKIEGSTLAAIFAVETELAEHEKWRDYWLSIPSHADCEGCRDDEKKVGSLDFHRNAISELDNVLVVLRSANELSGQMKSQKRWWQR